MVIQCSHSSICIMDLPAPRTISFLHGMDSLARGRVHVGKEMDSPARTACWPTAIVGSALRARRCRHGTDIRTDNGTDRVKTQRHRRRPHKTSIILRNCISEQFSQDGRRRSVLPAVDKDLPLGDPTNHFRFLFTSGLCRK